MNGPYDHPPEPKDPSEASLTINDFFDFLDDEVKDKLVLLIDGIDDFVESHEPEMPGDKPVPPGVERLSVLVNELAEECRAVQATTQPGGKMPPPPPAPTFHHDHGEQPEEWNKLVEIAAASREWVRCRAGVPLAELAAAQNRLAAAVKALGDSKVKVAE